MPDFENPFVTVAADALRDLNEAIRDVDHDAFTARLLALGLDAEANSDGRVMSINMMLGYAAGRLVRCGLSKGGVAQVVHHVWEWKPYFTRADLFPDGMTPALRDHLIRTLRWCLDELVVIVRDRDNVPVVAWHVMEMGIDLAGIGGVQLPGGTSPEPPMGD